MSIKDDLLPEMVMPEPKPELTEPNIVATIEDPDFPDNEDISDGDVNDIEDEACISNGHHDIVYFLG